MVASVNKNERGLSLVELMCALAILSILAVALINTGHNRPRVLTRAFQETLALRLAQADLEAARADPDTLTVGRHPIEFSGRSSAESKPLPGIGGWRTTNRIGPGLIEVETVVHWLPTGAKQNATARLTTRIATEASAR